MKREKIDPKRKRNHHTLNREMEKRHLRMEAEQIEAEQSKRVKEEKNERQTIDKHKMNDAEKVWNKE